MRSSLFILPPAAVLLCATAGAATTACTAAAGCSAAERLFSDYRYDRTAPLVAAPAPAASDVMVSPIGASLNAASVFSSTPDSGNGDIPPDQSSGSIQRRPEAAAAGFGGAGGSIEDQNDAHLNSVIGMAAQAERFGTPVGAPESAVAAWHRGRALGVSRSKAVGPRLSAPPNGANGGTVPGLSDQETPSVATPEPMALLLIGSGLVVIGGLARRRSAAHS